MVIQFFLVTLLISTVLVGFTIAIAHKNNWFDTHDFRKVHSGKVPRLGGIGIAFAFILASIALAISGFVRPLGFRILPLLTAGMLILVLGVVDDFKTLRPRWKLLGQMIAAGVLISNGFAFQHIVIMPSSMNLDFGFLNYLITFIWLIVVINAINLVDGVDGLAGGLSVLIALSFAAIFWAQGKNGVLYLCLSLVAALVGFLFFNAPLPRAKIFMGDGGSQFLGFIIAALPLFDDGQGGESLSLPYAATLLIIPICDAFAAIWRRTRDGRRIYSPDRAHMHHKLMNLGLNARGVDMVLYTLQMTIGILVYFSITSRLGGYAPLLFLAAAYILALSFFTTLHFLNRAVVAKASPSNQDTETT